MKAQALRQDVRPPGRRQGCSSNARMLTSVAGLMQDKDQVAL